MDLHEQGMSSRTFVIAAIVCVLLQAGLAPQISIAGGRVNFMIILAVSYTHLPLARPRPVHSRAWPRPSPRKRGVPEPSALA